MPEWCGRLRALRTMWMACPFRASSLQGHTCENRSGLVTNDPNTCTGWQQSRRNKTLLAVVGTQPRVERGDPIQLENNATPILHANGFSCTPRTWFQLRAPYLGMLRVVHQVENLRGVFTSAGRAAEKAVKERTLPGAYLPGAYPSRSLRFQEPTRPGAYPSRSPPFQEPTLPGAYPSRSVPFQEPTLPGAYPSRSLPFQEPTLPGAYPCSTQSVSHDSRY